MNSTKQAIILKERLPGAWVSINYIDIRACCKGGEEFYQQAQSKGVIYQRGDIANIYEEDGRLLVRGVDTLLGEISREKVDLVILANGITPAKDTVRLQNLLGISRGSDGFFSESHPQDIIATEREGIFLAGCCQGPKDIADTVIQASAAATVAKKLLRGKNGR
jgi:heterodisulfide reductase subunit A